MSSACGGRGPNHRGWHPDERSRDLLRFVAIHHPEMILLNIGLEPFMRRAFEPLAMIRVRDFDQCASPFSQRLAVQISHAVFSDDMVTISVI